jgi:2-polyprenyl-3-methyl-5-hydroxy-6-metoxy-1,4-benzoquinol methylase
MSMKQTPAHSVVNQELLRLIPDDARRVVEIGCMLGAMARTWRAAHPDAEYVGVDIDPDYAHAAAEHCTLTLAGDVERLEPKDFDQLFPSDVWIFGDCLEHLRDPWALLRRIRERIDPQGCLLACIPNAQHWSVQWRLASGQFRYEDSGLLDRTHIRWFTRTTMLEMFAGAGWRMEQGLARFLPASAQQEAMLQGIRALAQSAGLDPETAVRDATPFQYVFKVEPA